MKKKLNQEIKGRNQGEAELNDEPVANSNDEIPENSESAVNVDNSTDDIAAGDNTAESMKDGEEIDKIPLIKSIGRDFKNYCSRVKNNYSAFKGRIKGFFGKYKEEGPKQFTADCLKATWKGTKKVSKRWFIDAFTGMAQGLFVTLIAGTIIKQIGTWIGSNAVGNLVVTAGNIACFLMGAGIGAGIASYLKAPKLVIFASMVAGMIGAFSTEFINGTATSVILASGKPGNPIGAYICALIAAEFGKLVAGKTKLDILLVPLTCIGVTLLSVYVCVPFVWLLDKIGELIQIATTAQPVLMGIAIAVIVGILLTMPTSSAAICVAIKLGGIAGGAAVVGCACQMVGFAVQSFRENKFSGLISQGIGTSMLQIPNIMRKPIIFLPPIIASAIAGPIATSVFKLQCGFAGSGMGTSGLVGIFATITESTNAGMPAWQIALAIATLFFVVPVVVCVLLSELMRKFGWIKYGDMMLDYNN